MLTRRGLLSMAAAIPAFTEFALAQRALAGRVFSKETIWLNANENPEGPPPTVLHAMSEVLAGTNRYHFPEFSDFFAVVARSEQLEPEQVLVGAGSSEVLQLAVDAFTSPERPLIMPEPTFEGPAEVAAGLGSKVVRVPLAAHYAADVKRLAEEAGKARGGVIYLCNPNNPTSAITTRADLAWLVSNLPANTILLVDEAYMHFVETSEFESAIKYVRQGKDVIVTRTFSKLYGMAGLRIGFGCARPDLIGRMAQLRNGVVNIVGVRAVAAALAEAPSLVPQRRARMAKIRRDFCAWLRQKNLRYIEPHANFIMMDTGRDAREVAMAMMRNDIAVGRPFPPLDQMLRVTFGTDQEMARFKEVFWQVYGT
jgi:histidinol-phosphate aminotransferase